MRLKELDQNQEDIISLNVPLMIRVMEYAKEDTKTNMDLHRSFRKSYKFVKKWIHLVNETL